MGWLADRSEQRSHPADLWVEARSVVVLGMSYAPEDDPLELLKQREAGVISSYARGRDYHDVLKKRLRVLARFIHERFGCEVKLFVDTAPVMEKPLAQQAGIGWQGKHTNLVSRSFGSWLFLGEIYLALDLTDDAPEPDHCGSCQNCLDICPTAAFPAPYQLDARRCISYLTIEHKGPIPRDLRPLMGNRIYGCDDCLAVCPWNKFAEPSGHAEFKGAATASLAELALLDDPTFRQRFAGSPIKRIGRDRFIRNVLNAIGNSGEPDLAASAHALLDDPSPLVRGAAIWALAALAPEDAVRERATRASSETDMQVSAEWRSTALSTGP
jgi:epoxyqueuosine reductase